MNNLHSKAYELIFEGPADSSPETLRRLKSALLLELKFDVEYAQNILSSAPICLKTGGDRKELESICSQLVNNGAKAFILEEDPPQETNSEAMESSQVDLTNGPTQPEGELVFEFEMDLSSNAHSNVIEFPLANNQSHQSPEEETVATPEDAEALVDHLLKELNNTTKVETIPVATLLSNTPLATPHTTPISQDPSKKAPVLPDNKTSSPTLSDNALDLTLAPEPSLAPDEKVATVAAPSTSSIHPQTDKINLTPERKKELRHEQQAQDFPKLNEVQKVTAKPDTDERKTNKYAQQSSSASALEVVGLHITLPRSQAWKAHLPMDVVFGTVVGLFILLIGNYIWFSVLEPNRRPSAIESYLARLLLAETDEAKPDRLKPSTPTTIMSIIGSNESDNMDIRSKFSFTGDSLTNIFLAITTKAPAERSLEDIANDRPHSIWIRKIVAEDLEVSQSGDGEFRALGSAKSYIEEGSKQTRNVSRIEIVGKWDKRNNSVTGKVTVIQGERDLFGAEQGPIYKDSSGLYRIYLEADFKADKRHVESFG